MASSAPQSPAARSRERYYDTSKDRPSPSKLLRIQQGHMDRASSMPAQRLSSPMKTRPQIRPRLTQYYTIDHAVSLFKKTKNIIVLTGAGISTSLGVPDFRSENGVYHLLQDSIYHDPQELFHIENFKTDPQEFFKQAAKVFPKMRGAASDNESGHPTVPKFSLTHAFITMLQASGRLLTNYTQNIDGLEAAAGVSQSRLIQCHGTLSTATCMSCGKRTTARKYMPVVQAGNVPYCGCSRANGGPKLKQSRPRGRTGRTKRKRDEYEDTDSDDTSSKAGLPTGLLKPDMTFFGEDIPDTYSRRLQVDKKTVDLLVIVGTSLKAEPVNEMLLNIPPTVPQIWISKDRCQREGVKVDIELLGECDLVLEELARRAGWTDALYERLWQSGKTFETKTKASKPCAANHHNGRAKHDASTLPLEAGIPLQIRQKSHEHDEQSFTPEQIVIQVNGAEIASESENHNAMDVKSEANSLNVDGERLASKSVKIEGDNKTRSPPSKVIVELEEGTRNRWFVRRAK